MKILKLVIAVIALSGILSAQELVRKSTPWFHVGAYSDLLMNLHSADFTQLSGMPKLFPGSYSSSMGFNIAAGLNIDYKIDSTWWVGLRLGFSNHGTKLTKSAKINQVYVREKFGANNNVYRDIDVEQQLDVTLNSLVFEPVVSYRFWKDMSGSLGIKLSDLFTARYDHTEKLTGPGDVTFLDGSVVRAEKNGIVIEDKNSFQAAITLGLNYEFEVQNNTFLLPEIRFNIPLTNINGEKWKVSTLNAGFSLRLPVYPFKKIPFIRDTVYHRDTTRIVDPTISRVIFERTTYFAEANTVEYDDSKVETTSISESYNKLVPIIRDTVFVRDTISTITKGIRVESLSLLSSVPTVKEIETPDAKIITTTIVQKYEKKIPGVSEIYAKLEAWGINNLGQRTQNPQIVIDEIETEESFPLLQYVFFKEGSSDLKETNMNLLAPDKILGFSEAALPWNTLKIYDDLLNILGYRMSKMPETSITITGCNKNLGVEKNNRKLSGERAEAVKNYLTSVWGVAPERIKTASRNLPAKPANNRSEDGRTENMRAEIFTDNIELVKPIHLVSVQRTASHDKVEILPTVTADAGVKNWEIRVKHEDKTIKDFKGAGKPERPIWQVEFSPDFAEQTKLRFELQVYDSLGQPGAADVELPLQILTKTRKKELLIEDKKIEVYSLIVFDFDKADFTPQHLAIMKDIKEKIKPESIVKVSGYADRTGNPEYNRRLALRRCETVQKWLNIDKSRITLTPVGSDVLLYDNDIPQGRFYSRTVKIIVETPIK